MRTGPAWPALSSRTYMTWMMMTNMTILQISEIRKIWQCRYVTKLENAKIKMSSPSFTSCLSISKRSKGVSSSSESAGSSFTITGGMRLEFNKNNCISDQTTEDPRVKLKVYKIIMYFINIDTITSI